jgi:hypothetical protein
MGSVNGHCWWQKPASLWGNETEGRSFFSYFLERSKPWPKPLRSY